MSVLSASGTARLLTVEERVRFALLAKEVLSGLLDRREVGEVESVKDSFLVSSFRAAIALLALSLLRAER